MLHTFYYSTTLGQWIIILIQSVFIMMKECRYLLLNPFAAVFAMLLFPFVMQAQDKTYEFLSYQIKYPANYQVFTISKDNSSTRALSYDFVVSSVAEDGSEQRMKVHVERTEDRSVRDIKKYSKLPSYFVDYLGYNTRYFSVEEEMKGEGNDFYYADYTAKYYYGIRSSADSKLYYINIKGRYVIKCLADALFIFMIEIPESASMSTMQKIVNSLSYKPIYG